VAALSGKRLWRSVRPSALVRKERGNLRGCCWGRPPRALFITPLSGYEISSGNPRYLTQQKKPFPVPNPSFRKAEAYQRRFSNALGSTVTTTTRLVIISATVTAVTRKMLPLLAGNLPRMIQYCVPLLAIHFCLRAQLADAPEIQT